MNPASTELELHSFGWAIFADRLPVAHYVDTRCVIRSRLAEVSSVVHGSYYIKPESRLQYPLLRGLPDVVFSSMLIA